MSTNKRGPKDLVTQAKKAYIDEVVKNVLEVRKVIKVAGKEEAAKNKEVHQNHSELIAQ